MARERLLWWHLHEVRRLFPQIPGGRLSVFFFLFVYVAVCFPAATQYIFHTPMARYSLFVLKVPLNTNKTNIQVLPICHFHTVLKLTSNCYNFAFEQNVYRVLKFLENTARLTISKIIKNSVQLLEIWCHLCASQTCSLTFTPKKSRLQSDMGWVSSNKYNLGKGCAVTTGRINLLGSNANARGESFDLIWNVLYCHKNCFIKDEDVIYGKVHCKPCTCLCNIQRLCCSV